MGLRRAARSSLVEWQAGQMPLLITCSHDGRRRPEGVPERPDEQPGCPRVRKQADLSTRAIALGVSAAVEARTEVRPFAVIARFHRRYIDANRSRKCAFASPNASPHYREYHRLIRLAIGSIRTAFPRRGLLVDLHGAADLGDLPDVHVLLGTDNGRSLARLLALDSNILWRRAGLVRTLESAGFGVIPARASDREHSSFDGGFTVRYHGAAHPSGLDALQIEVVRRVRVNATRRRRLIQALAEGLLKVLARQKKLVER
jgi:N-formylglutamate amidohydrolase